MAQHEINAAKKAVDETWIPTIDLDLSTGAIEFIDEIMGDVSEFFHCRSKGCMTIARSVDWPNNTGGQYSCPGCGKQYNAWKESGQRSLSNKVINMWIQ